MEEPQNVLTGRVIDPPPPPLLLDGNALDELLRQYTPWSQIPAPIPPVITAAAWYLVVCDVAVTAWLARVACGSLRCKSALCAIATLSGHPLLTLLLAAGSLVALVVLAFMTRGFTVGTARVLGILGGSMLVAAAAVAGAAALVLLAVLLVATTLLLIVLIVVR